MVPLAPIGMTHAQLVEAMLAHLPQATAVAARIAALDREQTRQIDKMNRGFLGHYSRSLVAETYRFRRRSRIDDLGRRARSLAIEFGESLGLPGTLSRETFEWALTKAAAEQARRARQARVQPVPSEQRTLAELLTRGRLSASDIRSNSLDIGA